MRGVDHQLVRRSATLGKRPEQILPYAATRPPHETIINRCRWTISFGAITPSAAALEHMRDPADDTAIIRTFLATHISWQQRLYPRPLLIAQPK